MGALAVAATRWAELCSAAPDDLVEACYAPEAVRGGFDGPEGAGPTLAGRDALLADERQALRRLPDRRVRILRCLEDGPRGVVEFEVAGRESVDLLDMAAVGVAWWELDASGLIRSEWRHLELDARRPDDGRTAGWVPPADGEGLSQSGYRDLARRLAETWSWDPEITLRTLYADACVVERPGRPLDETRGIDALLATLAGRRPQRRGIPPAGNATRLAVIDCLGQGRALAVRLRCTPAGAEADPGAGGRERDGLSVLTLDDSDRILSDRRYLDWTVPAPAGSGSGQRPA